KTRQAKPAGQFLLVNSLIGLPSIEPYDNQNTTPRFGADFTYSLNKGKWDVSLGADYRRYDISGRREGYVNTYLNEVLTEFPSDGERSFDEETYSGRLSVQYKANPKHHFTLGLYAGKRTKERTADILYQNQQRSSIPQNRYRGAGYYYDQFLDFDVVFRDAPILNSFTYFNENLRVRRGDFVIGSFDYTYQIKPSKSLKISTLYERTVLGGPTDNANLAFPNTEEILQLQFNTNDNPLDGFRFQVDYEQELGNSQWESGYLFRFLNHPGDFDYFDRDLDNNIWIENPLFTNQIDLERTIHSAYTQLSGTKDKWAYNIGLRLEYFDRKVEIARPEEAFRLDQFNLFPSANFGYQLAKGLQAKLGYNRRIERTTTFKMTPFPEREHSETLEQGDAELLPEYIDNIELGLVKTWGDHSLSTTAYYRHVENVINRVNTIFNDTILNRIYTNAGDANALGFELALTLYPTKNWRFYLGGNVYKYQIEGQLFEEDINTSNTIYSINWNSNYQFTSTFSVQAAFNYLSRRVTAQGEDSAFYNPSLTFKKSLLDKRLNLSFQWLNIDLGLWAANEQRITTERSTFFTTTNYVYEVDILQLAVSYQLNSNTKKVNLPKSEFGTREF
ncbi:MAG: outer membrane beta-barrel family protein, partial [Bacteroidota bacterium]